MIETIRPTMSMVRDLLPGMRESWIFNDCAIGETKGGQFVALVMVRIEDGDIFYGFMKLKNQYGRAYTCDTLTRFAENFRPYPKDAFCGDTATWTNIREGHRYA